MGATMEIRVREVRPGDYARVAEVTLAAYDALDAPVSAAYREILADVAGRVRAGATVLVAEDAGTGEVIGSVTLTLDDNDYFEYRHGIDGDAGFRMLAVEPRAWGRGAGRALVDACVERARAAGCRRLVITSMEWMVTAHGMYVRSGFVRRPDLDLTFASGRGLTFALDLAAWDERPAGAGGHRSGKVTC